MLKLRTAVTYALHLTHRDATESVGEYMCAESVVAMLTTPPGSIASTKAAKRSDLKDHPNTLDSSGCCTSSVVAKEELTSNIS